MVTLWWEQPCHPWENEKDDAERTSGRMKHTGQQLEAHIVAASFPFMPIEHSGYTKIIKEELRPGKLNPREGIFLMWICKTLSREEK
jgi:hypothetical protein